MISRKELCEGCAWVSSRLMTGDAAAILAEAETRLAPRALASNVAWWDSQVEATEENAARRTEAELALSDTLADRDLFEAVTAAREAGANGLVGRQLDLLRNSMLTHQIPDDLRARIVELESSVDMRFSRHRGVVGGRRGRRHRDQADPSPQRRPGRAEGGVGGVEDGGRARSQPTSASSLASGTRPHAASGTATGSRSRSRPTSWTR